MSHKIEIGQSKVVESRETQDGSMVRRRREMPDGRRFTTYERIERPTILVGKKSGSKEIFDRDKLYRATRNSVGKFFASELEVEDVVGRVENAVYSAGLEEVESKFIGEAMLDVLAEVNEVAFVRFASVFREFKSMGEFEEIIDSHRSKVVKKKGSR